MRFVADLHIHSHYSRATSKDLDLEHLARWAQLKGVHVVATGDISHPGWLQEMREKLAPAEDGLYRLQPALAEAVHAQVPPACRHEVRFVLIGEISNIYKRHGQVRKVHNLISAPDLDTVVRIQAALEKIGNIRSDGRPILGLDSRDLLETILEIGPACHLIPAHIWTPWFSMLGSMSGFDSVEECFGDLTPHIFALETGLSSDPPMNWRVANLDRYTLVSNSDAHSPQKLAREATLFQTELSYVALFDALRSGDPQRFLGTVEFFPEEGKYHHDGHRKCGISWPPAITITQRGLCPVCHKPVTVGVMHRVEVLADRPAGAQPPRTSPYYSLIPLPEMLGELFGSGVASKRVQQEYMKLLGRLGPELTILLDTPLEEIAAVGGQPLAAGIGRMRAGQVTAVAGYDGEYGVIRLFDNPGTSGDGPQIALFGQVPARPPTVLREPPAVVPMDSSAPAAAELDAALPQLSLFEAPVQMPQPAVSRLDSGHVAAQQAEPGHDLLAGLNEDQRAAVLCNDAHLLIVAGPGTGKTRTLTVRIAHRVRTEGLPPEAVLAITFTNKAAEEMAARLARLVGTATAQCLTVKTFHAFGAMLLHAYGDRLGLAPAFAIYDDAARAATLRRIRPQLGEREIERNLDLIRAAKHALPPSYGAALADAAGEEGDLAALCQEYEEALLAGNAVDFDDLVVKPVRLLQAAPELLAMLHARFREICVDEYQDIDETQYQLLRLLTASGASLCAIGDPDQAIYGFRGANRGRFLSFAQDFAPARTLHLSRNYRSSQLILDAATQVIAKNPDRVALATWSGFVEQVKLDVISAPTDRAEAETVVHRIEQMVGGTSYFSLDSGRVTEDGGGGLAFADFAVLYRLGAQSRALAEALDRSGIPYQTVGQASLVDHKEVRTVLAHLWLLHSMRSQVHWAQVLGEGPGAFAPADLESLLAMLSDRTGPGRGPPSLGDRLRHAASAKSWPPARRRRLVDLAGLYDRLEAATGRPVGELIALVRDSLASLSAAAGETATGDLWSKLSLRAVAYGDRLDAFLEATALQSEADAYDPRADRVTLMTLHAAKGLEFPVVFIAGCEEGLLPYLRASEQADADVEEERRLFYVGMTRARRRLILTHCQRRFLFGQQMTNPPSRFMADIEAALKELHASRLPARPSGPGDDLQLRLF